MKLGESVRGFAGARLEPEAWAVEHGNWHQLENPLPGAPAVEVGEIVGPHQPHEFDRREAALELAEEVDRIGGSLFASETGDFDARVLCNEVLSGLHAPCEVGKLRG